jgi:phosphatidylglycerophosphatase A
LTSSPKKGNLLKAHGFLKKEMRRFIICLASIGYTGFFPFAPGTVGTLPGVLAFALFSSFSPFFYGITVTAAFFLGLWAAERAELIFAEKDSRKIVVDEFVGYLVTMAFLPYSLLSAAGGFLFFRLFDIMKPFPAGHINRSVKGGAGIMLDDIIAGIYANFLLRFLSYEFPNLSSIIASWISGLM